MNILGILSIPSIAWNIYLYMENKKFKKLDLEKQLKKKEIELEAMGQKHVREYNECLEECEGKIIDILGLHTSTLTKRDEDKLALIFERQQNEYKMLFTEIEYFQKMLGKESYLLNGEVSSAKHFKNKLIKGWNSFFATNKKRKS